MAVSPAPEPHGRHQGPAAAPEHRCPYAAGPRPLDEALKIGIQIADALDKAQRRR
jgi:hypothetical protein